MQGISVSVIPTVVTLNVSVLSKGGMFIPGLKEQNFRVFEDGVPQSLTTFSQNPGGITAVILSEFAGNDTLYDFVYGSIVESYTFAQTLKKEDRIALMTYDSKLHILQDYTQDKRAVMGGISMLRPGIAMSQETNLFDALYDTIDRLEALEGRQYVVLVSSGRDSSSSKTFDQIVKKVQSSRDIAIYSIGTSQALMKYLESPGRPAYLCPGARESCATIYAHADNQLQILAEMTGGKFYRTSSKASLREAFLDIGNHIRNQYTLGYKPSNRAEDGSIRRIRVELVDEKGQPLKLFDHEGKEIPYAITTREAYKAVQQVR